MENDREMYPFDEFPRGYLAFEIPRRKFLSAILDEVLAYNKSIDGGDVHKLSQLGKWSDEQLEEIIPIVLTGAKISIQNGNVIGISPSSKKHIHLFPLDCPALVAFNNFDGFNSITEAANRFSENMGWEILRSFKYIRGVFLALVIVGICQPKNKLDE